MLRARRACQAGVLCSADDALSFDLRRDRVISMAVGFGYLVVTTSLQCCIYLLQNLNTPHIFDLKDPVNYIQLSEKYLLMVDNAGMQVLDGSLLS